MIVGKVKPFIHETISFGLMSDGAISTGFATDNEVNHLLTSRNVSENAWHLVALTYDGNYAYFYVDGVLADKYARSGVVRTNTNDLAIGRHGGDLDQKGHDVFFNGSIDELRIYNRTLSDSEITELYQQGTPPEVTSISPTQAVIGKETVFEVRGKNLHPNMGFTVADCQYSNTALMGGTPELQRFVCTQFGKAGKKRGLIKTKPGGELLPYNFTVKAVTELDPNPTATVTGSIKLGSQVGNGIVLSNHDNSRRCVTDNQGTFRCEVPQGWSGTLIPQAKGVKFTPALLAVDNATGEMPKPPILGISTDTFPLDGIKPRDWKDVVGNAPWRIVAADGEPDDASSYEGRFALRSAKIQANQSSVVETAITVNQDSEVRFARRVSSHAGHGVLRFAIDGQEQGAWSGELPWQTVSFPITAGAHRLRWMYQKDAEIGQGLDAAWLDAVSYASTVPTRQPGQTVKVECEGATVGTLSLMTVRNPTCEQVQAYLTWLKMIRPARLQNADIFINAVKGIDVRNAAIQDSIEMGAKVFSYVSPFVTADKIAERDFDLLFQLAQDTVPIVGCDPNDPVDNAICEEAKAGVYLLIEHGFKVAAGGALGAASAYPYIAEKSLSAFFNFGFAWDVNGLTEEINSINIADDFLDEYYKGGMNLKAMCDKYQVTGGGCEPPRIVSHPIINAVATKKGYSNTWYATEYLIGRVAEIISLAMDKNDGIRANKQGKLP